MLVEIQRLTDIDKVHDLQVQQYLQKRFNEIQGIDTPVSEGYFVFVEDFKELYYRNNLQHTSLLSIDEGLFNNVEDIHIKHGIMEVSLLFNNEFLLSLVFYRPDPSILSKIFGTHSEPIFYPQSQSMNFSTPISRVQQPLPNHCANNSSAGMSSLVMGAGLLLLRCIAKR